MTDHAKPTRAESLERPKAGEREEHDTYLANYLRTGRARIIGIGREVLGLRKDGTVFPMELSVSEARLAHKRLFTGFVRDISDRKRLEKEVLQISALEQRCLGQDLHHGLCQQDGGGFVAKPEKTSGMGLRIMKYRAGMIVSTLEIRRANGRGMLVTCKFRSDP